MIAILRVRHRNCETSNKEKEAERASESCHAGAGRTIVRHTASFSGMLAPTVVHPNSYQFQTRMKEGNLAPTEPL